MQKQNKDYYSKTNRLLLKKQNSSYFMSSFAVIVGFLNFNSIEKEKIVNQLFS